ncbi:unnamed protein product [Trifolium pratense]|uniref:Uncharacterized protein n=1 Tax=Trifolium pratense TaxID=57577 RepID=A0ACB0JAJ8_TRIPR|nr:unnamed protein product [Trifolium pratense]
MFVSVFHLRLGCDCRNLKNLAHNVFNINVCVRISFELRMRSQKSQKPCSQCVCVIVAVKLSIKFSETLKSKLSLGAKIIQMKNHFGRKKITLVEGGF